MKLAVIIGSTREGRISPKVANWVSRASNNFGFNTKQIDLREYPMPFFDEAGSPQYNPTRKLHPVVKKFLDEISKYDAIAIVTPEYNRSYTAVLKNALDFIDFQIEKKPVLLIAYGSTGGAQAVAHLRGVIPGLGAITIPKAVLVNSSILDEIDSQGRVSAEVEENPYGPSVALKMALADLSWYAKALKTAKKA